MALHADRARLGLLGTVIAALLFATLSAVVAPPAARAAELSGVIDGISTGPENPSPFEIIITTVEFCLPSGTADGDTFTLEVSDELELLPVDFDVTSEDGGAGELVARGVVAPTSGGGGIVTITLTDYASTRSDVCGDFYFGARLSDESYDTSNEVTYTYDDTVEVVVLTTPAGPTGGLTRPNKFSFFTRDDQGLDDVEGAIRFGIQTPLGPFDVATIRDTAEAGDGFAFDCSTVIVRVFRRNADGVMVANRTIEPNALECSPLSLVVEVGPLDRDDEAVRVNVDADITEQLELFENTATVQFDDEELRTDSASLRRVDGGGVANGGNSPDVSIVKLDVDGNDADTPDDAADLGLAPGATGLVFTITNSGDEPLEDVEVTDDPITNGTITGLDCTFPDDSTGTTWGGPFAIGASFDCTADLAEVTADAVHEDVATVTAVGEVSGTPVDDDNPYHARTVGRRVLPNVAVPPPPPAATPPALPATNPRIESGSPASGGMRSPWLALAGFVLLAGATGALTRVGRRTRGRGLA